MYSATLRAPIFPRGEFSHTAGTPVCTSVPQFLRLPLRGCCLTPWLWWPVGVAFLGLMGWDCNDQRAGSWPAPLSGRVTGSTRKHMPGRSVEKAHLLVLELQPEGKLLVWHTRGLMKYSADTEAGGCCLCALPLPHSGLPVSARKELVPSPGTSIFVTASQGTL